MQHSTSIHSATVSAHCHNGSAKRVHPSDEKDIIRPYKKSLPPIDRPAQTSPVAAFRAPERSPPNSSVAIFPSFRSVSACNRCRIRKNRCDQRLPRCGLCEKAGVHCVGYDPITKREIPRSYVFFLESRVLYLESLLSENGIEFDPPEPFEGESRGSFTENGPLSVDHSAGDDAQAKRSVAAEGKSPRSPPRHGATIKAESCHGDDHGNVMPSRAQRNIADRNKDHKQHESDLNGASDSLATKTASDSRYTGFPSGISFARVVFAAVRSSVSGNAPDRGSLRPTSRRASAAVGDRPGSMRDSFFGLQVRPSVNRAPFPDYKVAQRLVNLYFEYANPQAPILHRGEFMQLFEDIYSSGNKDRSPRDLYLLNIVCAIGAGIIFDVKRDTAASDNKDTGATPSATPPQRPAAVSGHQSQPEEYHAAAISHLESCFSSSSPKGSLGGLEELQAVLLLASFALLRPVAPGLWYIVGVAMRLAMDLGLHHEDGVGLDFVDEDITASQLALREKITKGSHETTGEPQDRKMRDRGKQEWTRDLRRRLWWSVYSFDRLVSTCVGRPFGISDEVITTEFPSLLDDTYITKSGFLQPPEGTPSYKHVSHHYFKLRLLQSEIQQVLQNRQTSMARNLAVDRDGQSMLPDIPSSYLRKFDSFHSWRQDVHRRLDDWIHSAPTSQEIGVQFSIEFFELNYWQALTMLYRQSLVVPPPLAADLNQTEQVMSPSITDVEEEENQDLIYVKVAEAGQKTLRLYRQLHRIRLVNYTYLATHHLFMAGISFLYAIWHSPVVRNCLSLDEVDFTVLGAISVLEDLMEKCPPAEACRDAFRRMSKATVKMCLSTTGFGRPPNANRENAVFRAKSVEDEQQQYRAFNTPIAEPSIPSNPNSSPDILMNGASPGSQVGIKQEEQYPSNVSTPAIALLGLSDGYSGDYRSMNQRHHDPPQQALFPDSNPFTKVQPPAYSSSSSPAFSRQLDPLEPYTAQPPPAYSAPSPTTLPPASVNDQYLAGLDFLNYAPPFDNGQMFTTSTSADFGFSTSPFENGGSSGPGTDHGYGVTAGLQNDWNEGIGYGLFSGFFFGNGTGGS